MEYQLDFQKIGSRIQHYRSENHLTQAQLAELVGTNQKHISRIETGQLRIKLETMYAIAKSLHVSIDTILMVS